MEKVKNKQNSMQPKKPLKTSNTIKIKLDLRHELKNILNKQDQYTIPIFIPHRGCKNECIFCNQRKISGEYTDVTVQDVENIIIEHLSYFDNKKDIEIAFFGGSFTGLPIRVMKEYLEVASKYVESGKVKGIRVSTRPDYINTNILNILKKYHVKTIELGVQSMDNNVLEISKRGHNSIDVIRASKLIRLYDIELGHQMMVRTARKHIRRRNRYY